MPEHRWDCIGIITAQLRLFDRNSADLNGLLICDLMDLQAGESIEVIRAAFRERRVTIDIPGDLEEVEIEMGFRAERSTPKLRYHSFALRRLTDVNGGKSGDLPSNVPTFKIHRTWRKRGRYDRT